MHTYVPVKKIIKIMSTQRLPKRESSLKECLDSVSESKRRRGRWRHWLVVICVAAALAYLYSHRDHLPNVKEQIFVNEVYVGEAKTKDIVSTQQKGNKYKKTLDKPKNEPESIEDYSKTDGLEKRRLEMPGKPADIQCFRKKPYPKFTLYLTSINISQDNIYPLVKKGGSYRPLDCKPRMKVGIIVPYRNREHNLGVFLLNIHALLMQQKLDYQIFVIEQDGDELFNKGRLYNAGFREMMKFNTFHCVIFHDLDLLPTNENILYNCPTLPRHMCAQVRNINDTSLRYNETYLYKSRFGGAVAMTVDQFERANGFSNLYFGWGAEDNDMFWRLRAAGYPVVRYHQTVGVYAMMPHTRQPENPYRFHLLTRALERYKKDGLSNLDYYVVSTKFLPLCTLIVVEINPHNDNITELIRKWSTVY